MPAAIVSVSSSMCQSVTLCSERLGFYFLTNNNLFVIGDFSLFSSEWFLHGRWASVFSLCYDCPFEFVLLGVELLIH